MSAITIGGDLIHYEKLGRGRPVILVHGWIGSWRYWIPLMQNLHTNFSVYTLDLIGFGDSSKNADHYTINYQVNMLETFLDQLGIPKAAMLGHGLGAMVVLQFALRNPDKVARMLLASMPLFDPGDLDTRVPAGTRQLLTANNTRYSLAPNMDEIIAANDQTVASTGSDSDKTLVSSSTSSGIYTPFHELPTINRSKNEKIDRDALRRAAEERDKRKNSANALENMFGSHKIVNLLEKCFDKKEPEFEKLKVDVDKSDDLVLARSAQDFNAGDMLDDLRRVTAPVIAVHGTNDPIFPQPSEEIWNYLTLDREDVFVPIPLQGTRHFPMLEHDAFPRLTTDFLTVSDISSIEIRDRWRRRSR
ncbi:MAG: alpha/beta fold hydrolase [Anaerolineae bacterium]